MTQFLLEVGQMRMKSWMVNLSALRGWFIFLAQKYLTSDTLNPQKVVQLSFPTLVFLVRLSFEVSCKLLKLGKIFYPKIKILVKGFQK